LPHAALPAGAKWQPLAAAQKKNNPAGHVWTIGRSMQVNNHGMYGNGNQRGSKAGLRSGRRQAGEGLSGLSFGYLK